ncbi:Transcriptional coactivator/pterin dehydratase [Penicillium macrosclerotiorum]|uniref:Transcriptional coactivator/pterin dehydratase n=1 Tax=Penicillium macrosclerotiorum TaxID=303699 RepID=UPI0025494FAD|nr:Transcriptional coactivator/pterin dehydratase [Penicillium macrosclerotiorum]KAJ5666655.1 Transcriptional coactivator/pterin dehydratase [Penicillium macrosclerotiorum]
MSFPACLVGRLSRSHPVLLASTTPALWSRVAFSPIRMASNVPTPRFAEGEDAAQLGPDTQALQQQGWALDADGMGVGKTFHFKSYFKAVSFVNFIAAESSVKKHHPTMTVRIGSVDVHWTTHRPRGLTHKDIALARHCDNGAGLMGVVEAGQGLKCGPTP